MKQLPIGIPIITSLVAFILVLLALLAGSRPGFMEEYDIIAFNTSALGKNLIDLSNDPDEPSPTTDGLCDDLGGFLGSACTSATAAVDSIQSDIADTINDIGNDIADELATRLGIHEFYSLHALSICEGDFSPNATAPSASRNASSCTKGFTNGYNISALLDHGLRVGPLKLTLADLGFTDNLQGAIDTLNKVTKAFAVLLIISVGFTGLSLVASLAALVLIPRQERLTLLTNVILAGAAVGILILSGLVITIGAHIAVNKVNELGDDIGLSASAGYRYTIITWVAVGLMLVAFGYWLSQLLKFRKGSKMGFNGARKHARDSEESGHANGRTEMRSARGIHFGRARHG
ncbi:actin cortical patch SUR7/pH-response regulator pali [Lasiosphaeria hispida]|uniref:Actin cortical patch SUR7/pH-response regulator pali n=1 Tax=Lasiosphaeria hispida TaxID=260671 RepID=A0AAJ0HTC2_9PEZI|nr:actin cortical patch SUR7/pH-response regulator pali [Lasiosphaeria hispida]